MTVGGQDSLQQLVCIFLFFLNLIIFVYGWMNNGDLWFLQDKLSSRSIGLDGYFGPQQSMQGMVGFDYISSKQYLSNLLVL